MSVSPPNRRFGLRLAVVALALGLLGACSSGGDDDAATTTEAPATTAPTTAPALAEGAAPLTGLPLADAARRSRVALVVKIDNAPKARPQAGVNEADVVVSEKVEDGVTRLFTIFHSRDADPVGPVRSARLTDITLASALNRPLFAYSGSIPSVVRKIRAGPMVDIGPDRQPRLYTRNRRRPAPYNLFSSTSRLAATAAQGSGPPPPLFPYRAEGSLVSALGARPSPGVRLEYRGKHITTRVEYQWDAASGTYPRRQDGTPFVDAAGKQVAPRNVVVQIVEYVSTGKVDRSGTGVPEAKLVGTGNGFVFTGGLVVPVRWTRAAAGDITTYVDSAGAPVRLAPGQTWVELPPPDRTTVR